MVLRTVPYPIRQCFALGAKHPRASNLIGLLYLKEQIEALEERNKAQLRKRSQRLERRNFQQMSLWSHRLHHDQVKYTVAIGYIHSLFYIYVWHRKLVISGLRDSALPTFATTG
ncbi:hypothetical protein Tco_1352892 [Tanacetum coccineum]